MARSSTENAGKLPLGIVLPTRNSMTLLPDHIRTMRNWLDLVQEVVVVDSESADGTVEFTKGELEHPHIRFFDHPRGLYQSWNFGIHQIRSRYVYISSVGDEMTREGLLHLVDVAQRFNSDVVISEPAFVDDAGNPVADHDWPIHHILETLQLTEPICLETWATILFAFVSCPRALLGSSASNLYRAGCLKERPFPTEYGTAGDAAWGVANAHAVRVGVTPRRLSFFREHEKTYPSSEYGVYELSTKLRQLADRSLAEALERSPSMRRKADDLGVQRLTASISAWHLWQVRLERWRRLPWPWILNAAAWHARFRRDWSQAQSQRLFQVILNQLPGAGTRPPA